MDLEERLTELERLRDEAFASGCPMDAFIVDLATEELWADDSEDAV